MKLSDYIKALKVLEKKYGDLEVIYATDDEGNDFVPVVYSPTVGSYKDKEFVGAEEGVFSDSDKEAFGDDLTINADVSINVE